MRAQNALECPLPKACLRHCLAAHTPLTLLLQHRREQLQHLPVLAAHRDLGAGDVESFDFSGALEEGHGRRLRLAISSGLGNKKRSAFGCDDVAVAPLLLRAALFGESETFRYFR